MKRLGEQTPLRIDEAQSSTDSDAGVLDGFEHGIDLSGKAANEFGLVATVDVEPVVRLEPLADVSLFNAAVVALGIDDPDARCGNNQVVDVRPATGNPSVVEHDGSVSNGAHKVGRQLSFPLRTFGPRLGRLGII